ncbi:hypothetical protein GCM10022211_05490 [Sphingomonas humi]|uniref:Uncharacterized protein n=1 Tax=Sphingomonas humi TaxID=335630 RepID=A0ABP7RK39_9SPHN
MSGRGNQRAGNRKEFAQGGDCTGGNDVKSTRQIFCLSGNYSDVSQFKFFPTCLEELRPETAGLDKSDLLHASDGQDDPREAGTTPDIEPMAIEGSVVEQLQGIFDVP